MARKAVDKNSTAPASENDTSEAVEKKQEAEPTIFDNAKKPKVDENGLCTVKSKKLKDGCIVAVTGQVICFDKDGVAKCSQEDANYLKMAKDFEVL